MVKRAGEAMKLTSLVGLRPIVLPDEDGAWRAAIAWRRGGGPV